MINKAIKSLNYVLFLKDVYLVKHNKSVWHYSMALAKTLNLPDNFLKIISHASLFHDIGKIGVPNSILFKPKQLTLKEWQIMKLHSVTGAELLSNENIEVGKAVRWHHERWDGTGYPDRLSEENIPLPARIIAVADAYDALTTDRPYRSAKSKQEAVIEITKFSGTHFDPHVVEVFLKIVPDFNCHPISFEPIKTMKGGR
jgi:HD-GYP domain-containing protein (c-di-GMP phosphodiesterase class II)